MKKLTKSQKELKVEISSAIESSYEDLVEEIEEYNESEVKDRSTVKTAAEQYQAALADAKIFMDGLHGDMTEYYDARSEKWQEGDAGQNYQYWADQWDEANIEEYVLLFSESDEHEDVDSPEDQRDIFSDLPDEP